MKFKNEIVKKEPTDQELAFEIFQNVSSLSPELETAAQSPNEIDLSITPEKLFRQNKITAVAKIIEPEENLIIYKTLESKDKRVVKIPDKNGRSIETGTSEENLKKS